MVKVVIMLGSNCGERAANLDAAVKALRPYIDIEHISHDIDSPDYTGRSADYLNRIITGTTTLSLDDIKTLLKETETLLGRDRSLPGCVLIDIDVVIYDDRIVKPGEFDSVPFQTLIKNGHNN